MTDMAIAPDAAVPPPPARVVIIRRTSLWVRIWHWLNVIALFFLLLSGLQILNAHPMLYWGQKANFDHPLVAFQAMPAGPNQIRGVTSIAGHPFDTTGFLGASKGPNGQLQGRGFPGWLTIPSEQDLATGRRFHFFFAWLFVLNGASFLAYAFIARHIGRDLWPTVEQLRGIPASIWAHVRLKHPHGAEAARYNVLQKLAYLTVFFVLLPMMILTGLTMSPGMDAAFPVLPWAFGGRQSARTLHFISASAIVVFFAIHIFEVLASGPLNEMRSIITGGFRIRLDPGETLPPETKVVEEEPAR